VQDSTGKLIEQPEELLLRVQRGRYDSESSPVARRPNNAFDQYAMEIREEHPPRTCVTAAALNIAFVVNSDNLTHLPRERCIGGLPH